MHVLGHLSIEEFLRDYWQKKPVLIRQAVPGFEALLAADELAGMSLEDEIESRLIIEEGKSGPWEVRKGPFSEKDYRALPGNKWTLLVQAVDQWVPEAAELLEHFRFIPSWRIDDLMISYAVDGGSVGPHYDQYDVFLLQAEGQREWRIGQMCSEQSSLLKGPAVRILSDFEETERWVLEPGDMLYLPPKLAHWGIAQGECMTYSIGFRAPATSELLERAIDSALPTLTADHRYEDPDLTQQQHTGEITQEAIARLRALLTSALSDDAVLADTLGQLLTEPKYEDRAPEMTDECVDADLFEQEVVANEVLVRHPSARFAWHIDGNQIRFYAGGIATLLPDSARQLVALLTDESHYEVSKLLEAATDDAAKQLLSSLWQHQLLDQLSEQEDDSFGDPDD
ncbi:MAG: cupin domain-containing protein [Thalassolituus sp.]